MRIFLIRHGESQSNVDSKLHTLYPDHEIALSSRGQEQAEYAGEFLKAYFEKEYMDILDQNVPLAERAETYLKKFLGPESNILSGAHLPQSEMIKKLISDFAKINPLPEVRPNIKLYHSPYRRTKETKDFILKAMKPLVSEVKEDVLLCESQHGLFDGLEDDEQEKKFPEEFKLFKKTEEHNGKFWARYPHGESPFDVAIRLRVFFQSLKEDEENGVKEVIIIAHGITIKVFTMAWLNETPEWYEVEKSPGNCAIRVLEGNKDLGYIYGGHRSGKLWQYNGNIKKKSI
jgi:broad specificity phosphatase PhoE